MTVIPRWLVMEVLILTTPVVRRGSTSTTSSTALKVSPLGRHSCQQQAGSCPAAEPNLLAVLFVVMDGVIDTGQPGKKQKMGISQCPLPLLLASQEDCNKHAKAAELLFDIARVNDAVSLSRSAAPTPRLTAFWNRGCPRITLRNRCSRAVRPGIDLRCRLCVPTR